MNQQERNQLFIHAVALSAAVQAMCAASCEPHEEVIGKLTEVANLILEKLDYEEIERLLDVYEQNSLDEEKLNLMFINFPQLNEILNVQHS